LKIIIYKRVRNTKTFTQIQIYTYIQRKERKMSNGGFGTTFGFPNHKYCSTTKRWLSPEQLKIKELKETQLKDIDKEKKNKNLLEHIEELNKIIDNKNIDIGLKNETIRILKKENDELKFEKDTTGLIINQNSVRAAVQLLNHLQNCQISSAYTKLVLYSQTMKQYFTCIKLYNGCWVEGHLYINPVHNLKKVELVV